LDQGLVSHRDNSAARLTPAPSASPEHALADAPAAHAAARPMPGLAVHNLGRRYGAVEAVRGISFAVNVGETVGLLGPNGAGKTTTLAMLSTLLPPSFGDATICGERLTANVRAVRQLIGLVPQDISLYPDLSARENLMFFGAIYQVSHRTLRQRADELLALLGLSARGDDRVETYSGGMKRRLNLACGLVHRPRVLLLDEPTAGVDPQARNHILTIVREIARQGTAVLYTTHYMEEAEQVCDRIAIMDEGRIVAQGTLDELLQIAGEGKVIEIRGELSEVDRDRLRAIPDVNRVDRGSEVTRIAVADVGRALASIAPLLTERGAAIRSLEIHAATLEEVFMHLTGKALRD
jgi:ABC-2 type transport system ATP-binding protein